MDIELYIINVEIEYVKYGDTYVNIRLSKL